MDHDAFGYVEITGDSNPDAFEITSGGQPAKPRCYLDKWWLAPACRDAPETCVPAIARKTGRETANWKHAFDVMAMRASAYNLPLAIGFVEDQQTLESVIRRYAVVYFTSTPHHTFNHVVHMTFPQHSSADWAKGNKQTEEALDMPVRIASNMLQYMEPEIFELFKIWSWVQSEDVENAVRDSHTMYEGRTWDVACRYLHEHSEVWAPLIRRLRTTTTTTTTTSTRWTFGDSESHAMVGFCGLRQARRPWREAWGAHDDRYGECRENVHFFGVHDGHCKKGWLKTESGYASKEVCAARCFEVAGCSFFAWTQFHSGKCALYGPEGCVSDGRYPEYMSYAIRHEWEQGQTPDNWVVL
jgi:hypothetical protein